MNMGLFYPNDSKSYLMGYADASYLSDHNDRSQTRYLFTCSGTTISWQFGKQTITTTSSNRAEILTLHEGKIESTTIYEDNSASISLLKE